VTDVLHWSFDTARFVKVVLPRGFAAADTTLPQAALDPEADWEATYDIVYMNGVSPLENPLHTYYGEVSLKRRKASDDTSVFSVDIWKQTGQNENDEVQSTHIVFKSLTDSLATLAIDADGDKRWHITSEVLHPRDPAVKPYTKYEEWGRYRRIDNTHAVIEKSRDNKTFTAFAKLPTSVPLTSNWGLMDAVQRLQWRKDSGAPVSFTLLHSLEELHHNQVLGFLESFEASFGGRRVNLHGYYHIGEGIMPAYYWVADDGRLLIARFGLAAFVYKNT